jgi:NDP-sugar pyrophosphorylase family protein
LNAINAAVRPIKAINFANPNLKKNSLVMTAMLFAAGLGTRLQPLTQNLPKVLVPVNGVPLLERNIIALKNAGFTRIIINVHYRAMQIVEFLKANQNFGVDIIISDESDLLLDTGGGLKKVATMLTSEPFVVLQNADILCPINYALLIEYHQQQLALATLAVSTRSSSRNLLFNNSQNLVGWVNTQQNSYRWCNLPENDYTMGAFNGVHVVDPMIINYFSQQPVFSIIDTYLKAAKAQPVKAFWCNMAYWFDVGSIEKLENANQYFAKVEPMA